MKEACLYGHLQYYGDEERIGALIKCGAGTVKVVLPFGARTYE